MIIKKSLYKMANFMDDLSDIDFDVADVANGSENSSYLNNNSFDIDDLQQEQQVAAQSANFDADLTQNHHAGSSSNQAVQENLNEGSVPTNNMAATTNVASTTVPVNTMMVDQQQSQSHQRVETMEAGAQNPPSAAATSQLEQALNISDDDSVCDHLAAAQHDISNEQNLDEFEFGDDDDFFADLPPINQEQTSLLASKPSEEADTALQSPNPSAQAETTWAKEEPQKRLQLTKADLRRKDVPLFDCIFCVKNSGLVMKGMLQKSLVNKFLEVCREISGNEQIPVQVSNTETMTKYDPERVQALLGSCSDDEPFHLKQHSTQIKTKFLQSSLWLGQQRLLPAKHEKVFEQRFKQVPQSFKRKVTTPLIRTQSQKQNHLLNKSQQSMIYRRAMYATDLKDKQTSQGGDNSSTTRNQEETKESNAAKVVHQGGLNLAELEEEEFTGKVTITNWAMTHKQKIYRDISFDSEVYNIYDPKFESDEEAGAAVSDDESSEAKICDERLSSMNPCSQQNNSEFGVNTFSSDNTELERCQAHESENLHDDDIRESLVVKNRNFLGSAILEDNHAMETPLLSDISSFNPNDPQVRQIDLDSSSLSGSGGDLRGQFNSKGSSSQHKKMTSESNQNNISVEKQTHLLNYSVQKDQTDEEVSSELSVADEVIGHSSSRVAEQSLSHVLGSPVTMRAETVADQRDNTSTFWGAKKQTTEGSGVVDVAQKTFLNNTWMQMSGGGQRHGEEQTEFQATDFVTGEGGTKPTRETPLGLIAGSIFTMPQPQPKLQLGNLYNTGAAAYQTTSDAGYSFIAHGSGGHLAASPGYTVAISAMRPLGLFNVIGQQVGAAGASRGEIQQNHTATNASILHLLNESSGTNRTKQQSNRSVIMSQGSTTEQQLFKNPFQTFSQSKFNSNEKSSFQTAHLPLPKLRSHEHGDKSPILSTQGTAVLGQTSHSRQQNDLSYNSTGVQGVSKPQSPIDKASKSATVQYEKKQGARLQQQQEVYASSFPDLVRPLNLRTQGNNTVAAARQRSPKSSQKQSIYPNQWNNIEEMKENILKESRSKSWHRNLTKDIELMQGGHSGNKTFVQMIHPTPTLKKVTPVTQNTGDTQLTDSISPVKRARSPIVVPTSGRRHTFTLIPQETTTAIGGDAVSNYLHQVQMSSKHDLQRKDAATSFAQKQRQNQGAAARKKEDRFNWQSKDGKIINATGWQQHRDETEQSGAVARLGRPHTKVQQVVSSARRNASQSPFDFNHRNSQRMQSDLKSLKQQKVMLQKQDSSNLNVITTQRSREFSEDNFKAQSAYQNKLSFKQKTEPMSHKSFLKSVHENSRKVQKDLLKQKRSTGLNLSAFAANDRQYFNGKATNASPRNENVNSLRRDHLCSHRNTLSLRQALVTSEASITPRRVAQPETTTHTALSTTNQSFVAGDQRLFSEKVHARSFIASSGGNEVKVVQTSLPASMIRSRSNNQRLKNQFKYLSPKMMGNEAATQITRQQQDAAGAIAHGDQAQRPTVSNFQGTAMLKRQEMTEESEKHRMLQFWHQQGEIPASQKVGGRNNIFKSKTTTRFSSSRKDDEQAFQPAVDMVTDQQQVAAIEQPDSATNRRSLVTSRAQQPNVSYSKTNNLMMKQEVSLKHNSSSSFQHKIDTTIARQANEDKLKQVGGSLSFVKLMKHQKEKIFGEFNNQQQQARDSSGLEDQVAISIAQKGSGPSKRLSNLAWSGLATGDRGQYFSQQPQTQRNKSRQHIITHEAYATQRDGQTSSRSLVAAAAARGVDDGRNSVGNHQHHHRGRNKRLAVASSLERMTAGSLTNQSQANETRLTFFKLEAKNNRL